MSDVNEQAKIATDSAKWYNGVDWQAIRLDQSLRVAKKSKSEIIRAYGQLESSSGRLQKRW